MDQRLNIKTETTHYIKENIVIKFRNLGLREDFMTLTPKQGKGRNKLMGLCQTKKLLHPYLCS